MLQNFDQEKVIKGITSFSVASVESSDDFWLDTFEILSDKLEPERLD